MRVLEQSPWAWTLLDHGGELVLSVAVLAQGPMSGQYYSVEIVLDADEAQAYADRGAAAIDDLAERVNESTEDYRPRLRRELSPEITAACIRWREQGGAGA